MRNTPKVEAGGYPVLLIGPGGIGKTGYFYGMSLSKKIKALTLYAVTGKTVFHITREDGSSEIRT